MNNSSSNSHKRVERSTTLNRKYVKRPTPRIRNTAEIHDENLRRRQALAARMNRERLLKLKSTEKSLQKSKVAEKSIKNPLKRVKNPVGKIERHPLEISARKRLLVKQASIEAPKTPSMKERKEQAIKSALASMAKKSPGKSEKKQLHTSFLSFKRVSLALCCAVFVVGIAIYFIHLSMPSISVGVAAMQSGIDATYPSYTPKGFSLSSVKSENNSVSMQFKSDSGESFILTEEKSSWNSSALESNYVKGVFKNKYSTIREQGLTIFISDSNAIWVNGGKLFTISSEGGLSKNQLVSIATSL